MKQWYRCMSYSVLMFFKKIFSMRSALTHLMAIETVFKIVELRLKDPQLPSDRYI